MFDVPLLNAVKALACRQNVAAPMRRWPILLALGLAVVFTSGCSTTHYLARRDTRENALAAPLHLLSRKGPQLQERTSFTLRRYGLEKQYSDDPAGTLVMLRNMATDEADPERQFAVAELAYIEGKKAENDKQVGVALEYYSLALTSSYEYLFAGAFHDARSPYDPQFRGACNLYNEALEDSLRLLCADNRLRPGASYTIASGEHEFTIETAVRGNWSAEDFDHFEFVSDYEIQTLNNRHRTYGLGVPLIAVRKQAADQSGENKFYPDGLSFPVTALLRTTYEPQLSKAPTTLLTSGSSESVPPATKGKRRTVLEFYDPLNQNQIHLANHWVPLQTDITTPLAYFLDTEQFRERNSATKNLLYTGNRQDAKGLFMLEPYDPNRIPVVMVHGLWSSPLTWMDMFNDLRSFPDIRERYQFWFYLYPTGQPFWISATQMRADLAAVRETFDPARQHVPMDQMVLVGHSMGGLVSRMQTIDSGNDFWELLSDKPVDELKGDPEDINKLVSTLRFKPNNSVSRVITIATPHRGSDFANPYTRWLGRKFIQLPKFVVKTGNRLIRENPGTFKDTEVLTVTTSIDSLSPECPIFPVMLRAKTAQHVSFHNIIGVNAPQALIGRTDSMSDGIVSYQSASVEGVESEKKVDADHVSIHTKPETILEVRRILRSHLEAIDKNDRVANLPDNAQPPVPIPQPLRQ